MLFKSSYAFNDALQNSHNINDKSIVCENNINKHRGHHTFLSKSAYAVSKLAVACSIELAIPLAKTMSSAARSKLRSIDKELN